MDFKKVILIKNRSHIKSKVYISVSNRATSAWEWLKCLFVRLFLLYNRNKHDLTFYNKQCYRDPFLNSINETS